MKYDNEAANRISESTGDRANVGVNGELIETGAAEGWIRDLPGSLHRLVDLVGDVDLPSLRHDLVDKVGPEAAERTLVEVLGEHVVGLAVDGLSEQFGVALKALEKAKALTEELRWTHNDYAHGEMAPLSATFINDAYRCAYAAMMLSPDASC
ncbi:hypothetical protein ACIA8G_21635 [Lentzea sp. NPDC051213]|uniref:hypothetical protein n=1 Tax=Lentzea sp. NPDC051213 TaxID=3364126 RepID=UPI00379241C2